MIESVRIRSIQTLDLTVEVDIEGVLGWVSRDRPPYITLQSVLHSLRIVAVGRSCPICPVYLKTALGPTFGVIRHVMIGRDQPDVENLNRSTNPVKPDS